jgi:hypothetical protein
MKGGNILDPPFRDDKLGVAHPRFVRGHIPDPLHVVRNMACAS